MQTLYVPKYGVHYRVNPKDTRELQWSKKPFGPMTSWQHAMTFNRPIRALDTDDQTGQGVVVLNDSSTYVGSGVRVWGRKYYTAGSRIYSLYSIGESNMTNKLKIKVHERNYMDDWGVVAKQLDLYNETAKENGFKTTVKGVPAGADGLFYDIYFNIYRGNDHTNTAHITLKKSSKDGSYSSSESGYFGRKAANFTNTDDLIAFLDDIMEEALVEENECCKDRGEPGYRHIVRPPYKK